MQNRLTSNLGECKAGPSIIDVGIGIVVRRGSENTTTGGGRAAAAYEILITKRKPNTVFPGFWELPGGKSDPGETPETCVRRELKEEVGVEVEVVGRLSDVVHTYAHGTVRLHPCLCRLRSDSPAPSNLHVAAHAWCGVDTLGGYEFPPANDGILAELRAMLGGFDLERATVIGAGAVVRSVSPAIRKGMARE